MKQQFYPVGSNTTTFAITRKVCLISFLFLLMLLPKARSQELVFKNSVLQSGMDGKDNAIYRFSGVATGIDALVKISGRSSSLVTLQSIDLATTGFSKAFQPQVTYNGGTTPAGTSDWWMEFTVSFVNASNSSPVSVNAFTVTALDIDGNGDKLNEWVSFYGHSSYTVEQPTQLQYSSIWGLVNNISSVIGTQFNGPITNYTDIDTAATKVMASTSFLSINTIKIRTGGHSTGSTGAADRMYSFWFKGFRFQAPVNLGLPVTLKSFGVKLENNKPLLNWISSKEENFSHYVIERSSDGSDYKQVAIVFANGTNGLDSKYSYQDNAAQNARGILYYRLRMVDIDQQYKYSETRLLRMTESGKPLTIQAYPNPALNELRVTIPSGWQDKQVQYDIYNVAGQTVKRMTKTNASQTETIDVSGLNTGSYIIRVTTDSQSATQQFVKSK